MVYKGLRVAERVIALLLPLPSPLSSNIPACLYESRSILALEGMVNVSPLDGDTEVPE